MSSDLTPTAAAAAAAAEFFGEDGVPPGYGIQVRQAFEAIATATIGEADDDGYCLVTVRHPDGELEHHSIRCDHASVWTAGELACLNESPEERAAYLEPFGQAWLEETAERDASSGYRGAW